MRVLGLALAVSLGACAAGGAAGGAVLNAALNTAIGLGASAVSRAQGDCYASCPDGTTCNHATGLCDPLPCRGRCATNEVCDPSGPIERCLPQASAELKIDSSLRSPAPERVTPR